MLKINLRDYYPFYQYDSFVEVPEEVAEAMQEFDRQENAYQRRMYRNNAQYSLDQKDGIEHDILLVSLSPWEIFERKVTYVQIHTAVASLPEKQAKRIYAHYFLGMSKTAIAKAEGVGKATVCESIKLGLKNIEIFLKNIL